MTAYACLICPSNVGGVGVGPEDLVHETFVRVLEHAPDWDVERGGAFSLKGLGIYMRRVMVNILRDHLKRPVSKTTRLKGLLSDDDALSQDAVVAADDGGEQALRLHAAELCLRLQQFAKVEEDTHAVRYLDLVMSQDDVEWTDNAAAARKLGVKPPDVVNIKKRIRRYARRLTTIAR